MEVGNWKAQKLEPGLLLVKAQGEEVQALREQLLPPQRQSLLSEASPAITAQSPLPGAGRNILIYPMQRQLVARFSFSFGICYGVLCSQC